MKLNSLCNPQHTPMILTLADVLLVSFPPDVWLLSLYFITNLLFSFSNMLLSTDSSLPYGLHQAKSVIPSILIQKLEKVDNKRGPAILTSSSALSRLILRCSLSFSRDINSATRDNTLWVDCFKLQNPNDN